jgi:putative ABC transport system permease protein
MWLRGVLRRRPARAIGLVCGVALAVAFLAALGAFFGAAKANLTRQAVADVPVDWQVQLTPGADARAATDALHQTAGVTVALPVSFADSTGVQANVGGTVQTTGAAKVLGLPPDYATTFPGELRLLTGTGGTDGVLLAQQTAANLHAAPGDRITIGRTGAPPATVTVTGVVDLPVADSLFQKVGAAASAAPQAPPDNVVLLPAVTWHQLFDQGAGAAPEPAGASLARAPGGTAGFTQLHVRLDHKLPTDPVTAFAQVQSAANNLEVRLAGAGTVGDNLAARLDAARADAVYAQLLFLFLGLPGALLAGALTVLVGAANGGRRHAEQALLRMRGASTALLLRVAGAEALLVGLVGAGLGSAIALLAPFPARDLVWSAAAAVVGVILAAAAVVGPAWRDARGFRLFSGTGGRPLWARLYLDVLLLVGAWLLYRQTLAQGFHVVLAPEGVPTVSVDYTTLAAPLLLWGGAALLAWRLANLTLGPGRRLLARAVRPLASGLSGLVVASMSRQRRLLARGLVLTALTTSFGVSTALFNTTYANQARVDAQLTNGADVTATTPVAGALPADMAARVRKLPGVAAAETMQHRFAYVGNDLQDMYGIDAARISGATTVSDAYFAGGDAAGTLAKLARQPDAVLVSAETVKDFQLQPGDLLRLRLQSTMDHTYHEVPFHYAGTVREFPTAPTDSFLIANASYIAQATGSSAGQTLLVRTAGSAQPPTVAAAVRQAFPPATGVTVQDISTQLRATLSGLTAVDLAGLTRIELGFALLLAMAATGLVLALGLAERRRTFAITTALGARARQLAAFVWSEALFVTLGGVLLGGLAGWLLAQVLVTTLTGVFDPPPEALFVPWSFLSGLAAAAVAAVVVACGWALRSSRRPVVELVRDL